mmetsp:Transcript_13910/g.23678  ORF Transcript_13910/g.23678 Transcript_13910/m.23678 type:complete len:106 (+) Transcript_13910:539-856(+)
MLDNGGIRTFYKGYSLSLLMSSYGFIQMCSYETLTHLLGFQTGQIGRMSWDNLLVPFVVGGLSRSLASITLLPLNVTRTRMQMRTYSDEELRSGNIRKAVTNFRG